MPMTRREALVSLAVGGIAVATAGAGAVLAQAAPEAQPAPPPGPVEHQVVPLPFDAKKLAGISEKMIVSHHDKNYAGAVKNLNKVKAELNGTNKDTAGFIVGGLKQSELQFMNSVVMHEHYFGNLGGDGKANGAIEKRLAVECGSFARWEELFRSAGMSLAGGSGWVVLDYNFHTDEVRSYWSGNHTLAMSFGKPLLVMDMYEHAYQMDYGAAANQYVDAFFQNINWDAVNRRFEQAQKGASAMRG